MCEKTIKFQHQILNKDIPTVLLLSGGSDSVCVAHFLSQGVLRRNLHAFHFNHGLRPQNDNLVDYVEEDETNTDFSMTRNWIRGKVRPEIESRYPGLMKVVKKKVRQDYENI
jgi:tRNA(Ile)-lysidine synthase TilS/MesJ